MHLSHKIINNKLTFKDILFFSIFFLSLRIFLVYFFLEEGPDWEKYLNVAKNILNGCGVSQSYIEFESCKLSFGPNNGPGYPFYISIFLIFLKDSINNLIYFNIFFSFLANLYLLSVIKKYYNANLYKLVFIILSLSPLTIGWYRFLLPETLTLSFGIIMLAEIIILLKTRNIFFLRLSVPIILASFIRLDALSYIFLIFIIFYLINKKNIKKFFKYSLIIILIVGLPWNMWFLRNYIVSSDVIVPIKLEKLIKYENNFDYPSGFHRWVSTWSLTEYSRSNALHNIQFSRKKNFEKYTYENIVQPKNIYYSLEEKRQTDKLFKDLKLNTGKPFPSELNSKFLQLANNRLNQKFFNQYFIKNLKRMLFLSINPVSSNGLPIEIDNGYVYKKLFDLKYKKISNYLLEHKNDLFKLVLKFLVNFWKISLLIYFLYLLFYKKLKNNSESILLKSCYFFYFIKIFFLSIFFLLESRYLATAFHIIEIPMIIFLFENKFTNFSKKN